MTVSRFVGAVNENGNTPLQRHIRSPLIVPSAGCRRGSWSVGLRSAPPPITDPGNLMPRFGGDGAPTRMYSRRFRPPTLAPSRAMMASDKRRHWRPWTEMLLAQAARRVLRGEPPAKDVADDDYWLRARQAACGGQNRIQEEESEMTQGN